MVSIRRVVLVLGITAVAAAVTRHLRGRATAEHVEGGILIRDTSAYDRSARFLFGSYFTGIANDVAALAPPAARTLDVGCGPGQLSIKLAERGLVVTGVDLDPEMIERARTNAASADELDDAPEFMVANAASLPFPDATFDIVVSTMSMHHWDDPAAGLAEIARVLRPTGRALIWDLRKGGLPFHPGTPDPVDKISGAPLRVVAATAWRWPWRFAMSQRIELTPRTLD